MLTKKITIIFALAFFCLSFSSFSRATPITLADATADNTWSVGWTQTVVNENSLAASADLVWDVQTVGTEVSGSLTVTLTTNDPGYQAAIMAFGFDTSTDLSWSLISPGSIFASLAEDVTFAGHQSQSVCTYASNNCAGGAIKDGLQAGNTDTFVLGFSGTAQQFVDLTFSDFAIKWQTEHGSFEPTGVTCFDNKCKTTTVTSVPEPSTLALFTLGTIGVIATTRRKHKLS